MAGEREAGGRRRIRRAGNFVYAVLVLAALVLVLGLSMRFRRQWDATVTRDAALSPQTLQVLERLTDDVHVYGLFTSKEPRRRGYLFLLMKFQEASPHVKVQFVDPVSRPGIVKELGIGAQQEGQRRDGITVVVRGDRKMVFRGTEEEDVTNGLLEVGSSEKRVVGFLRGYGEHETGLDRDVGMSKAVEALKQEYYEVRDVSLADGVPADVTVLVAAGPMLPIPLAELDRLAAWLEKGGRLLALLEADEKTGLSTVLERWGVKPTGELLLDPRDNMNRQPEFLRVTSYTSHPIARGFGKNLPTAFPIAQAVTHFEPGDPKVYHDDVAKTGEFSYSESASGARRQGPFATVVASWKRLEGRGIGGETRVVLVGDSDFATNLRLPVAANRNFFLNCVGWLSREQNLVSVRRVALKGQNIELRPGDASLLLVVVLVAPFLVVLVGILVGLRRRSL